MALLGEVDFVEDQILVRLIFGIGPVIAIEKRIFAPVVETIDGSSIDLRLAGRVSLEGLAAKLRFKSATDTTLGLLGGCTVCSHKEDEAKDATDRGGKESLVRQPMQRSARKGDSSGKEQENPRGPRVRRVRHDFISISTAASGFIDPLNVFRGSVGAVDLIAPSAPRNGKLRLGSGDGRGRSGSPHR